ncbi:hypothetical protein MMPV_008935 [Pyropia vietnamensis]
MAPRMLLAVAFTSVLVAAAMPTAAIDLVDAADDMPATDRNSYYGRGRKGEWCGSYRPCEDGLTCKKNRCHPSKPAAVPVGGKCTLGRHAVPCVKGATCRDGVCQTGSSAGGPCGGTTNAFCAGKNLVCHRGTCVTVSAAGGVCDGTTNAICGKSLTCKDDKCATESGPGGACGAGSNAFCGKDLTCSEKKCVTVSAAGPCLLSVGAAAAIQAKSAPPLPSATMAIAPERALDQASGAWKVRLRWHLLCG